MTLALAATMAAPFCNTCAQNLAAQDDDAKYATELLETGAKAPDFSLKTPEGKTVKLSDFHGKYVVLDFWASWCPDCIKDIPNMKRMYETYKDRNLRYSQVVPFTMTDEKNSGTNLPAQIDNNKDNWTAMIKKQGIKYTQVSELKKWKTTEVSKAYKINWIPTLYLIDKEGKVVLGTVMSEKMEKALGQLSPVCE